MDRFLPIIDNEWYHVYNRGNDRRALFHMPADYDAFIEKLRHSLVRYLISKIAFVLMPNHFHLVLLQPPGGNLPRFMNSIETSFARRYNLRYHHKGHVFGGRYRCAHVATEEDLLDLVCYIHMNPVQAGLVHHPKDWRYSDFQEVTKDGIKARDTGRVGGHFLVSAEGYGMQIEDAITNLNLTRRSSKGLSKGSGESQDIHPKHRQGGPSSLPKLRGRVP